MSYPLFVEGQKLYKRNVFFFTFGFVIPEESQTGPFRPALRKLGEVMKTLEIESQYLSNPATKRHFGQEILPRIAHDLNRNTECIIPINNANMLALQIIPKLREPPYVRDYQVPISIVNFESLVSKDWGLTFQQVIPFIDGIRHVKRIAADSGVDTALVRRCLRQLLYYRCIIMIDIFQYSNMYMCTPRIRTILEDVDMQRQCVRYISTGYEPLPPINKVCRQLYYLRWIL